MLRLLAARAGGRARGIGRHQRARWPRGQARRVFNLVVQAMVAAGHTVLMPTVRGSIGYGKRWYSLDDVRLRLESVADLADLRAWTPGVGGDPARVALYGGSYGGAGVPGPAAAALRLTLARHPRTSGISALSRSAALAGNAAGLRQPRSGVSFRAGMAPH